MKTLGTQSIPSRPTHATHTYVLINDVMDNNNNNNNNNNNLFTYIAPFNIYGMIKGALQSKKTNITIDTYNKNAIYNR